MPYGSGGGSGGLSVPSDQIFNSTSDRDAFFSSNTSKLVEGAQCVVLTSPPSGLYQVYISGAWQDRTAVVLGPKGDAGDPSILIDDSASKVDKTYSSEKIENTFAKIDDSAESEDTAYSSQKTKELIDSSAPNYIGQPDELMKLDGNGDLVPSGVISKKDGSLSLSSGSVDIGPHTISSSGEGIEATNDSSGESYNFVFAGQGDDNGPVDRILGAESSIKTTEDLSLELTNHVSKLTATADVRIIKQPVTIKPVASQTNVTMQITDLNGSDLWTYGPFDIVAGAGGDFKFTISTVLDFKIGEYLVTFLSPDGDVTLYGGTSPVSGESIVYGELPFRPFHDETLHNIKNDSSIIRTISVDPNSNLESTITADGELILSDKGTPPPGSTVDIAFWWSDNAEPDSDDILNAMSQGQTSDIVSHTDGFTQNSLQSKTMTARRDEDSFKYAFFAWPSDFFSPEPELVDTGFGGPSTWLSTTRIVDGVTYKILTVEIKNNSTALENYSLVQEGRR